MKLCHLVLLRIFQSSTALRLHQPPPVEAVVLRSLSESLTTILPDTPSPIDTFYRAKSALEAFFDSFLALPTDTWTIMPLFTMLQSLWSVTMLARWAKVMGPGHSRPPNAPSDVLNHHKFIWDPSERKHLSTSISHKPTVVPALPLEQVGQCSNTDIPSSSTAPRQKLPSASIPPSRLAQIPTTITDPAQISATQLREAADPDIPHVVATLKAKLQSQPGLSLDIVGILATLAQRCQQAHERLMETSADGAWQDDVWYLCEKKVLIARAKIEKWAEIIAAGGFGEATQAGAADPGRRDGDVLMGVATGRAGRDGVQGVGVASRAVQPAQQYVDENAMVAFQREMEAAAQGILPSGGMYDGDMSGNIWMDSMFDSLDPSMWLNDGSDWSIAMFGPRSDMAVGFS